MALKELLMHVPDPTGYQAFVGLLRNLNQTVLAEISDFSFDFEHISGKHMFVSDFLSHFSSDI